MELATTQKKPVVWKRSRNSNSASEFTSGWRTNHSSFVNGSGSSRIRAACVENETNQQERREQAREKRAEMKHDPAKVTQPLAIVTQQQGGRDGHGSEQRARLVREPRKKVERAAERERRKMHSIRASQPFFDDRETDDGEQQRERDGPGDRPT